jgi:hypothetical protein
MDRRPKKLEIFVPLVTRPDRLRESLCWALLLIRVTSRQHTPRSVDGPVRVFMIVQSIGAVAINVAHSYVSLT